MKQTITALLLLPLVAVGYALDHDHDHSHHQDAAAQDIKPPRIFLDKSLRIVMYQLNRLDNQRLLLVERKTDDPKYAPVFSAILTRAGMSRQYREEALEALVKLRSTDATTELLAALDTLKETAQDRRTGRALAVMLLAQPSDQLKDRTSSLQHAAASENEQTRRAAFAGLMAGGATEIASRLAKEGEDTALDWLAAIGLLPNRPLRSRLRPEVLPLLEPTRPVAIRRGAIRALSTIPSEQDDTFRRLAPLTAEPALRTAAVRTLLQVPAARRDALVAAELVTGLVTYAESTPPAQRTTDEFVDAMQLADQLLARIPVESARSMRDRLREVTVRVVRIHTVEEEMRYDTPYFAVEAGRPVQLVLDNEDLMPHNLVITTGGALQEVAEAGASLGPNPGFENKPYVPKSDKVLFATDMVQAGQQVRLTFTAPSESGEYPYVCTFPRHWMRMYGVMVVVPDLDAWLQNPVEPKDPIGSNRSFVQSWTAEELAKDLTEGLRGRTAEIGHRLFVEATCAQCHKVAGQGGTVGPELTDVFKRWKGDRLAVLREILDPSHRIDPKYAVQVIVTTEGRVITGIVQSEDKTAVSIVVNPEAPEPTVVQRSDIDEIVKTSKSMMPKALLDKFTKDEVFEILAFLEGLSRTAE